jgi:dTDP-4-dehydrorhamnose reductase
VDEGVIQNRLWTGDVAEMAAAAALSAETGVFHIGTTDSSTEHEFLSRLARAFGHDASLVVKKASVTRNLVVVPDRIWSLPGVSKITEAESIERIASDPSLQKYRK